jgi:hypothetical protein
MPTQQRSSRSGEPEPSPRRPTPGTRKSSEDDELIITPGGLRPKSQVHLIEPGYHVSGKGGRLSKVETATGRVVQDFGPISKKKHNRAAESRNVSLGEGPLPDNGWIENSGWSNTTGQPIAYFSTTWVVPPAPATTDGQIIYLFNGLEQSGSGASPEGPYILQPVLQWGTSQYGSGNYWSIGNWYVNGAAPHGTFVPVNPGDVIQGVITLTGQSESGFSYLSSFIGYPAADYSVTDIDELQWACETLECYNISQCSDYPNNVLTAMYDIELKVGDTVATSTDADLAWATETNYNDCGQNCIVVSNDSPGGAVYLYYRQVTQDLYFLIDQNAFGKDQVQDVITSTAAGRFSSAFWLVLEGFTPQQVLSDQPSIIEPTVAGQFSTLTGVTVEPSTSASPLYDASNLYTPQRILYPFDIVFAASSLTSGDFPATGETAYELTAAITIEGTTLNAATIFDLVAGANPYLLNIDPSQNNAFYLSEDLRVFTITPEVNNSTPIGTVPFTFQTGSPTTLDPPAAYTYIQNLIGYLNQNYSDPNGTDPFEVSSSILPQQSGALTGDSSVTPTTPNPDNASEPYLNYNFALARVRLRGSPGAAGEAANTKVFFRLFTTQTNDTDYINTSAYVSLGDPNITYPSSPSSSPDTPAVPLPGTDGVGAINGCTLPFFAAADQSDLGPGGVNNQDIEIPASADQVWAYFGCFINVYDSTYIIGGQTPQYWLAGGTHHCIVAQIAYDGAPIENSDGTIESPANCDRLAQRNLQVTPVGNPGYRATHVAPQTFDTRPSPKVTSAGYLIDYPDELMIDWGNAPTATLLNVYWPATSATNVVEMAQQLYSGTTLSALDAHTIQCANVGGLTFMPIPRGAPESLAGLISLTLPPSIRYGQQFDIVIRRITSRQYTDDFKAAAASTAAAAAFNWRYVVGAFQMSVPSQRESAILPWEERLLAFLRWRFGMVNASNRWHPVLQRYLGIIAERVKGFGGNPAAIAPSQFGLVSKPLEFPPRGRPQRFPSVEYTGKVSGISYSRFGDFEGFLLVTDQDHERYFRSAEPEIEELVRQAWISRILISVFLQHDGDEHPAWIILRRPGLLSP